MRLSPLSSASRLARALTALVTVWCLGCSAFEPLLAGLVGRAGAVMACGDESAMGDGGDAQSDVAGSQQVSVGAETTSPASSGYDCGCQSCQVPSPGLAPVSVASLALPRIGPAVLRSFVSVERQPLVPPPQSAT